MHPYLWGTVARHVPPFTQQRPAPNGAEHSRLEYGKGNDVMDAGAALSFVSLKRATTEAAGSRPCQRPDVAVLATPTLREAKMFSTRTGAQKVAMPSRPPCGGWRSPQFEALLALAYGLFITALSAGQMPIKRGGCACQSQR
jgi:hypothetical protein